MINSIKIVKDIERIVVNGDEKIVKEKEKIATKEKEKDVHAISVNRKYINKRIIYIFWIKLEYFLFIQINLNNINIFHIFC